MSKKTSNRVFMRICRHRRVRKKISGSAERPRLCVYRSSKHIYAQMIDDITGMTLLSASTQSQDVQSKLKADMDKTAQSKVVGQVLGEKAQEQGIKTVTFDRGGYRYHGRVEALADGVRASGVQF